MVPKSVLTCEAHMQGTKVEGTIGRLFEGHMHMFIECIGVDYKSTRRESFMDLQLDVKGCKDIYSSFDKYCEVEVMDGQNQYQTDEHGMQVRLGLHLRVLHQVYAAELADGRSFCRLAEFPEECAHLSRRPLIGFS